MSLKERMAQTAALKDAKRAERQALKTLNTGAELAVELARGRSLDLEKMRLAVTAFNENPEFFKKKLSKTHKTAMAMIGETHLTGEWAANFVKLAAAIPLVERRLAHKVSWLRWREIGLAVGMPEEDVVNALQVMLVFRSR